MKFSLDTNIVLRLLLRDIEDQYVLAKLLVDDSSKTIAVSDLVFVELEYALKTHYKMQRTQVANILSIFVAHPKIDCNKILITEVLKRYVSFPALLFTDICLVVLAEMNGHKPIYTFDKKLATQQDNAELLES